MKALSIHPYYAMAIMNMKKTIEVRTWTTKYRGDILICSTAKNFKDTIPGYALCVAMLKNIEPLSIYHIKDAMIDPQNDVPLNSYAWKLENIRCIKPFPIKGRLSLWECDQEIEYLDIPEKTREKNETYIKIYSPLIYKGNRKEW